MPNARVEEMLRGLFTYGTASLTDFRRHLAKRSEFCINFASRLKSMTEFQYLKDVESATESHTDTLRRDLQINLGNHPGLIKAVVGELALLEVIKSDIISVVSLQKSMTDKQEIILKAEKMVKATQPGSEAIRILVIKAEEAEKQVKDLKKQFDAFKARIIENLNIIRDLHVLEFAFAPDPGDEKAINALLASNPQALRQKASSVLKGIATQSAV